ncbi:MAG: DUF192 domain-containing protein [Erysipelotrichaceae bacterium]|nr:DUF192 domain-containing protein [Erysipelotrichaceae bacterium]
MNKINLFQEDKLIFQGPIYFATGFFSKLKGLMFKKTLNTEEGILFKNVNKIHTCFMHFSIDVVYLSKDYEVIYVETVAPWKIGSSVKGAKHVLELNKGLGNRLKKEKIVIRF